MIFRPSWRPQRSHSHLDSSWQKNKHLGWIVQFFDYPGVLWIILLFPASTTQCTRNLRGNMCRACRSSSILGIAAWGWAEVMGKNGAARVGIHINWKWYWFLWRSSCENQICLGEFYIFNIFSRLICWTSQTISGHNAKTLVLSSGWSIPAIHSTGNNRQAVPKIAGWFGIKCVGQEIRDGGLWMVFICTSIYIYTYMYVYLYMHICSHIKIQCEMQWGIYLGTYSTDNGFNQQTLYVDVLHPSIYGNLKGKMMIFSWSPWGRFFLGHKFRTTDLGRGCGSVI